MRLLLDQGLPKSAAEILRRAGMDAIHTSEVGKATASEDEIIVQARSEDRIVVTLDADFHALMAVSNASSPSVIRIRIEGLKAPECAELIKTVIEKCEGALAAGCLISVEPRSIRMRKLPLQREGGG
jgi:predicted nuclease of predicted toxin-antitoxin system